jgi:hypothetical protein
MECVRYEDPLFSFSPGLQLYHLGPISVYAVGIRRSCKEVLAFFARHQEAYAARAIELAVDLHFLERCL